MSSSVNLDEQLDQALAKGLADLEGGRVEDADAVFERLIAGLNSLDRGEGITLKNAFENLRSELRSKVRGSRVVG